MPRILQNHYVLSVHDLGKSAAFYEMLGFKTVATPPGWVFLAKDNCMLMLGECPDDPTAREIGCHSYFGYLKVDDVDGYRAELVANGVQELGPIANKPWGMREFTIRTPDGHGITVGQQVTS